VLGDLLGNADRAAVLERTKATHNLRTARFRELMAVLEGTTLSAHEEEFAWVVGALGVRTAS
jgi:hypothetical protein